MSESFGLDYELLGDIRPISDSETLTCSLLKTVR